MLKSKGIMSELQKELLFSLSNLADFQHFYLTGGTALAEFYGVNLVFARKIRTIIRITTAILINQLSE